MIFDWFNLISLAQFLDSGLVSQTLTPILAEYGQKTILITRGNETGITYEDLFLAVNFNGENPWVLKGDSGHRAIYLDTDQNVWLGIEVPNP
jgi:hypothetical protein